MNLADKNILITGGSNGIGKAAAELLVRRGAKVAITGRDKKHLEETASEIGAFPIHADVSSLKDVKKTYEQFLNEFGSLDALINNAGLARGSATIDEISLDDLAFVYSVNVFGLVMMGKEAAKIFKKQNHGNIINIGSTAAYKGYERGTIYASSKWAVRGMTECWRAELRKHNVRVMLINPSYVPTSFGLPDKQTKQEEANKLTTREIAYSIAAALEMDERAFIPELSIWATNPF